MNKSTLNHNFKHQLKNSNIIHAEVFPLELSAQF